MSISCPACAQPSDFDPGDDGCMLRCTACGTEWMARRRVASPYRNGFQGRMERNEEHDSLIIEHYPPAPDTDTVAMRRASGARGWAGRIIATAVIVIGVFVVARAPVVGSGCCPACSESVSN